MNSNTTVQPFASDTERLGPYTISQWHGIAQNAAAVPPGDPLYAKAQTARATAARYIRGWAEARASATPIEDPGPHPGRVASAVVGFGQGASSGFADELAAGGGAAASMLGGNYSIPGMVPAMQQGRDEHRAYLEAARNEHPGYTYGADAAGMVSQAVVGGGLLRRGVPAIGKIFAAATEPAENFFGMFRHLPQKLAASIIGAGETGTVVGTRAAGETDGSVGDRARNAAVGFGTGALVGGGMTMAGIQAALLARTAWKGLAPVFSGWRGAAGTRAAVEAAPVVARSGSEAEAAAIQAENAAREHMTRSKFGTPEQIEAVLERGRNSPTSPLYRGTPTPSGGRPEVAPTSSAPVVGEAQMPGQALHDVAGNPIPGTVINQTPRLDPREAARTAYTAHFSATGDAEGAKLAAARAAGTVQRAAAEIPSVDPVERAMAMDAILKSGPSNANREQLLQLVSTMSPGERVGVTQHIQRAYPAWWRVISTVGR